MVADVLGTEIFPWEIVLRRAVQLTARRTSPSPDHMNKLAECGKYSLAQVYGDYNNVPSASEISPSVPIIALNLLRLENQDKL